MHQALTTPQILETIFLSLDQQTLLTRIIRVCRHWRSTITSSTPLQQHLFLKPNTTTSLIPLPSSPFHTPPPAPPTPTLNPLLLSTFPPFFHLPPPNPSIFAPFAHQPPALSHFPLAQKNLPALTRRGASWRGMQLRQPPITKLGVIIADTAYFTGVLDFPGGLRMGELYDLAWGYSSGCREGGHKGGPAAWCVVWRPRGVGGGEELHSVDEVVEGWMEEEGLEAVVFVVRYDEWGARVMGLEDGRFQGVQGGVVDWEASRCEEYREVEVMERFYYLVR